MIGLMRGLLLLPTIAFAAIASASTIVPDQAVYNLAPGTTHLTVTGTVHNDSTFQDLIDVGTLTVSTDMGVLVNNHLGDAGWFDGDGGLAPGGTYSGNLFELFFSSADDAAHFANMSTVGFYEDFTAFDGDSYVVNASELHSAPEPAAFLAFSPALLLLRRRKR